MRRAVPLVPGRSRSLQELKTGYALPPFGAHLQWVGLLRVNQSDSAGNGADAVVRLN